MANSSSNPFSMTLTPLTIAFDQLEHGSNVFFHCQAAENRRFLRQVSDAHARTLVHRQVCEVDAVQRNGSVICRYQPRDHIEHGGFAGSIGPEKPDGLTLPHRERHPAYHWPALVALAH